MLLSQAQLQYQISPIILTGGIATNISGGMLSVLSLLNTNAFSPNLLSGADDFELDDAFGIFAPVVGGSLVQQTLCKYPMANLSVASNAIIREPIQISLVMMTPMKLAMSWETKLATMTALKQTLDQHNNAGGTYTILTPAYTYENALMIDLVDVSIAASPLPQNAWRWDFELPLVSLAAAAAAMSNLLSQITNGVPTSGAITSPDTASGQPASSTNAGLGAGGTAATTVPSVPIGGGAGNVLESPTGTVGGGGTSTPDPLGWSVTVTPPGGSTPPDQ